jgi:Uma2 family endonuclease
MTLASPPILTQHRFKAKQYRHMVQTGVLGKDDRVELLDGIITDMSPIGSRHAGTVRRLSVHFSPLNSGRAVIGVQDPIALSEWSQPEPDLWLAAYRPDLYASGHPVADDILLIVEVADSSMEKDARVKLPLYSQAKVPEVWLVDLNSRTLHRHRSPEGGRFCEVQVFDHLGRVYAMAFPDLELSLAALFAD